MIACCSTSTAPFSAASSADRGRHRLAGPGADPQAVRHQQRLRAAEEVAEHLLELGFTASTDDVVTSAQSAAGLLAQQLPAGAKVLVVGTDALAAEVSTAGLTPVRLFSDEPAAVVQGHSTTTGWPILAEAALAIRAGALWVAANVDRTLPTERGLLPGNGAMVAALKAATDAEPQVAGKPAPALMRDALARGTFQSPLVVGDRLDTDIEGANAADLPSLMVLTGVNTRRRCGPCLPSAAADLHRSRPARPARRRRDPGRRRAPGVARRGRRGAVTVSATGADPDDDGLSVVRATARAVWDARARRAADQVLAGDDTARAALERWSVLAPPHRLAVNGEMNTDPEQIRADIDAVLAQLPSVDPDSPDVDGVDIDAVGRRLEEAHQILVNALESVEKG